MTGKDRKCSECNKTFATKRNCEMHARTHTGEKPFKCPTCDKCFGWEAGLKIHIRLHTGETPFKCKLCEDQFSNSSALRRHIFTHIGSPYKCPICPSTLRFPHELKVHSRVHTGEKPFKCSECDMKFMKKGTLVCHMQCHTVREKRFSCDICLKKYRHKSSLKEHLRVHTDDPFKCKTCDFQTFYEGYFRTHLKDAHESDRSLFQCSLCGKTFRTKEGRECHIRGHTGERPYKCKLCGKRFISSIGMKKCIQNHTGEKPYENERNPHKCKICSKFFAVPAHLKSHMVVHTGEKTFQCPQCPKKFGTKQRLVQHLGIHNGGNYKCTFCPKDFFARIQLAEHLRVHTGEKPFKCKLCPYKNRCGVRPSHMKNHEKEEKFKCRFCTFSCAKIGSTVLHEQRHHCSDVVFKASILGSAINTQISRDLEARPLICKECKFSCFSEKIICIHYSQCHGLPRVTASKLTSKHL